MASLNKVTLIGNLGRDPEVRYTADGSAVANITIATSEQWKDKTSGEKKEKTEWHRIVFFGRLGEIVGEYLRKGSSVYIEGKLTTRKWQDKDGSDRYTTEIVANELKMLGERRGGAAEGGDEGEQPRKAAPKQAPNPAGGGSVGDMIDDIPF